jgi:hypothetical protein
MFKNFRDKVALSGVAVLVIGVMLLISTFIAAYGFLTQTLSIIADGDLVRTFGEALAPLIAACIHIMYLGVMGWVGSLVTIRGVTLIVNAPKLEVPVTTPQKAVTPAVAQPQPQVQTKPVVQPVIAQKAKTEPEKEKPKPPEVKPQEPKPQEPKPPEPKAPEPEIVVIPPDELMPQQPPQQPQSTTEKPQNSENKPQSSTS